MPSRKLCIVLLYDTIFFIFHKHYVKYQYIFFVAQKFCCNKKNGEFEKKKSKVLHLLKYSISYKRISLKYILQVYIFSVYKIHIKYIFSNIYWTLGMFYDKYSNQPRSKNVAVLFSAEWQSTMCDIIQGHVKKNGCSQFIILSIIQIQKKTIR